jgi:large repetitive protein
MVLNTETGVLSGTPASGTGGSYPITITASNGVGSPAVENLVIVVDQAPAITSANSTTFTVGTSGSFQVMATGFPAATFSYTGTLPNNVTLSTAGLLSGTPASGTQGSYPITITASNGIGTAAQQSFTLMVNQGSSAPAITSANNTTFTVGAAGSFQVMATGSPTPTFS